MRIVATLFVLGLACAHGDRELGPQRDQAAIVDLLRTQQDAWNRGDLEGFLRGYDPGPALVFTSGGQIRRGFAETRARYHARYGSAGARSMGQLEFEVLDVRLLGPGGAVVLGRWHLRFPGEREGPAPQPIEGVFSLALLRTPAGWRIVHDHTSTAQP